MQYVYFRVTSKKLHAFLDQWREQNQEAIKALLRFSRRVGGSRTKFGSANGFGSRYVSIVFNKEPDRKLWKRRHKDSDEFWVPKARTSLAKEFTELQKAFPSRNDVADEIGLDGFGGAGHGGGLRFFSPAFGKYDGTWVITVPEYYKPKKGLGLRRMSDTAFEKLEERDKAAA